MGKQSLSHKFAELIRESFQKSDYFFDLVVFAVLLPLLLLADDAPPLAFEPAADFVVLDFPFVEAFAPLDFFAVSLDFAEDLPAAVFAAVLEAFDFDAVPEALLELLADLPELLFDLPESPAVLLDVPALLLFDEAEDSFAFDVVPALFDEDDEPFALSDVPEDLAFDEAPPFFDFADALPAFDFEAAPALLAFEPEDFCPVAPLPVTASAKPLAAPTAAPVAAPVKTSAATSFTFSITFAVVDFFDELFAVDFLLESFLPSFLAGIIFLL